MLPLYIQNRIYTLSSEILNEVELFNTTFSIDDLKQELRKNDIFGYRFFDEDSNKETALNFLLNILINDKDIEFSVAQ